MSEQRPVTITASEFLRDGYTEKIARGECVVRDYGDRVLSIKPHTGKWAALNLYDVVPENNDNYRIDNDNMFTVEWLPQPEREEAAAREFADGWRDAEIARLQGDKSKLREALRNIAATARSERGAIRRLHTIETLATEALSMFVDSEPDHK